MSLHTWGLVLSGGGGKGAYQIGVYKALIELGIDTQISAISGASIGAINAVLIANGDYQAAENAWNTIRPNLFLTPKFIETAVLKALSSASAFLMNSLSGKKENRLEISNSTPVTASGLTDFIKREGLFSRDGLLNMMNSVLDYKKISNSNLALFANATRGESVNATCDYFPLNGQSAAEIRQILLASTALPYIYEPIVLHGIPYRDGGVVDNIPVKPLLELGLKHIIVVYLNPAQKINPAFRECANYLEIIPSRELGDFLDGTIDFQAKNVRMRIELGYFDTMRTIRHYQLAQRGIPVCSADKAIEEERDFEHIKAILKREEL